MRAFRKGRVDIIQTVLPAVAAFCDAALDERTAMGEKRRRLLSAAQGHAVNVVRANRGAGLRGTFMRCRRCEGRRRASQACLHMCMRGRSRVGL
jgi:Choline/Carnitine o-acyltransferase